MNQKIFQNLGTYLPKSKINIFDKYYNSLKSKGRKIVFLFCLNYTLEKNKDMRRKTGEPNVMHSLEVALMAIKNKLSFTSVCASLLHDIVEDELSLRIEDMHIKLRGNKNSQRMKMRKILFSSFQEDFYEKIKDINHGIKADAQEIIQIVDILTRYRTKNPNYYFYINSSFGKENRLFDKEVVCKALIVKFLDRTNNIISMDTTLKKILNNKIKSELRILDQINNEVIRNKYKKTIHDQASLLIDHSFSEGRRLNQIWKNTYLLLKARMFFCLHKIYQRTGIMNTIEQELLSKTLEVLQNHKNDLKLYLSPNITEYWDAQARTYSLKGGFKGKTKPYTGKITKENQYLTYNNTLEKFSTLLLKDNEEYRQMQVDKEIQYKYLALIYELLKKIQTDKDFVCDISKTYKIEE